MPCNHEIGGMWLVDAFAAASAADARRSAVPVHTLRPATNLQARCTREDAPLSPIALQGFSETRRRKCGYEMRGTPAMLRTLPW